MKVGSQISTIAACLVLLSLLLSSADGYVNVDNKNDCNDNNDSSSAQFLSVDKSADRFSLNGQPVWLSGVNQAWDHYGRDFGNNLGKNTLPTLDYYLQQIHAAGGNSIRIWLHVSGETSPLFNSSGYVIGTDAGNTLISDMRAYLVLARQYDILVFFCLWNSAIMEAPVIGLLDVETKLESYINNCLIPMVSALANETSLGGWEIMNEPEGSMDVSRSDPNPCFDGPSFKGGDWTNASIPVNNFLKFINWQAAAIHETDPKVLVTTGSWMVNALTDNFNFTNHYSDKCLIFAGGKASGTLDFYQVHTYDQEGKYQPYEPFLQLKSAYGLSKPLVIGEFSSKRGAGRNIQDMYHYAYKSGYAGGWAWQAIAATGPGTDGWAKISTGIQALKGLPDIPINITSH